MFLTCLPRYSHAANHLKTILVYYNKIRTQDISKLARYDILVLNRFNYNNISEGTWKALKQINPDIQIYVYQAGPEVADNTDDYQDVYLTNIGRYGNARNHPMGDLTHDQPHFFLLDKTGLRINNPRYTHDWLLDFGSSEFQKYWLEATKTDIVKRPWSADGIFVDNCPADAGKSSLSPFGGPYPRKYPNPDIWNEKMNQFVIAITEGLHKMGQKVLVNRGNTKGIKGYNAWLQIDNSATDYPDILMEEGAFVVKWGKGQALFFSEAEWKRQIDTIQAIKHSDIALLSHTDLKVDQIGVDNYGKKVDFWQTFWYAISSYYLAFNKNRLIYFMFSSSSYDKIYWFDEYKKIDLGEAVKPYEFYAKDGVNVYWREFEKGFVYVNPTNKDIYNIILPVSCVLLDHNIIYKESAPKKSIKSFDLPAHHGLIFIKNDQNPQNGEFIGAPKNVRILNISTN